MATSYAILAQAAELEHQGYSMRGVSTVMLLRHPPTLHSVLSLHLNGCAFGILCRINFVVTLHFHLLGCLQGVAMASVQGVAKVVC